MPRLSPTTVVGCLIDVSASMRSALEAGRSDEQAIDRLRAVLRAALKLAQAEQRHDPHALVFVGVFGLDTENGPPPVADLCGAADALLGNHYSDESGHDLLIARANKERVPHITRYIRDKLTDNEARIVDTHLERHPELVKEFLDAIPSETTMKAGRAAGRGLGAVVSAAAVGTLTAGLGVATGGIAIPFCVTAAVLAGVGGGLAGDKVVDEIQDDAVEKSEAIHLARQICAKWLQDFAALVPRPVDDVIRLLEQLQEHADVDKGAKEEERGSSTLLDTLRRYMYGLTPMQEALRQSLVAFDGHHGADHRVLVLVSDGLSTDGDPLPLAHDLKRANVSLATIYLTSNKMQAPRELYYQPPEG